MQGPEIVTILQLRIVPSAGDLFPENIFITKAVATLDVV